MPKSLDFSLKMEAIVYPVMRFKSGQSAEIKLQVVMEDLEAALVQLGDRNYRGPVQIRMAVPWYGRDMFAGNRMDHVLFEVDFREVTCMVITDTIETFTFSRQTFVSYLRSVVKEINKRKDSLE